MRRSTALLFALTLASLAALAPRAAAQSVRGQIVAGEAGTPVAGALVLLVNGEGREVGRILTAGSGGFSFSAPGPGRYRVRVLRIGFARWESPPIELAAGASLPLRLAVPTVPLELPELVATAAGGCRAPADAGDVMVTLLDEVQKTLAVTQQTARQGRYRFAVERFHLELDPRFDTLAADRRSGVEFLSWPVRSLPPDSLAELGFVRKTEEPWSPVYYGPDPAVLFSDAFARTHCLRLLPDSARPGMIGLGFEPVEGTRNPDIAGVLWVDRNGFGLRELEFEYTGLPRWVPRGEAGGSLEFAPLPDGGWVIRRWWLRAPVAEVTELRGVRLHGWVAEGGDVTELLDQRGRSLGVVADARRIVPAGPPPGTGPSGSTPLSAAPLRVLVTAQGDSVRRIAVRNDARVPVHLVALHLTDCVNLSTGCGTITPDLLVAPGRSIEVLTVRPAAPGEWRFRVRYEWRTGEAAGG